MGFKRFVLSIFFLILCVTRVSAQWDAQLSQYWAVKTYYNPAFAGESNGLQLTALDRQQWLGINNAPKTFIFVGDAPINFLGRTHGVGLVLQTEKIGLFTNSLMGAQYVFKKKFKKNILNIGVQIGLANIGFDASGIHVPDDQKTGDNTLPTGTGSKAVDGNIGLSWLAPQYYIGLSSTHITQPRFDIGDNTSSYISRTYYLTAGYNIKLKNPLYELRPSVLVKSDVVVTQYDLTLRLVYSKMFNGGISWRKDAGFVFLLGASLYGFDAGYAYDLASPTIGQVSSGSHELYLRYHVPIKPARRGRNAHKSVRIL